MFAIGLEPVALDGSLLISNRGFAECGESFSDPVVATALLDRLLHHAVVIQIEAPATAYGHMPI